MNEVLVIRLGADAAAPVDWLVWSPSEQTLIASGTLDGAGALSSLHERAGGRPVRVLVPASELLFREVSLPGRGGRQALQALPYLLEEEVASDIEQLHLVVLHQQGPQVHLVAVEHTRMAQWQGWLSEAGLVAQCLLPDVLTLPLAEPGQWSAVQCHDSWLFRQNAWQGMQAEASWLPMLLGGFDPPPQVVSYSPIPVGVVGDWQAAPAELPLQLMLPATLQGHGNLLTGRYRRQPEWQRWWRPWRKVAIAAGILLTVWLLNQWLSVQATRSEADRVRAQTVQLYRQLFPGEQRVINPRSQMNQHLKAASGNTGLPSTVQALTSLAPLFAQVPGLRPDQLRYDGARGELRIQATASGYQEFDRFRELAATEFEVRPGDMKTVGDKVQGTLVLRSKS